MTRLIEDYALSFLQRRCVHPGEMVAADVLEGSADITVAYCRRYGAIRLNWSSGGDGLWRLPDPHLWRG